jgi:diguanylate cyclase (GGDEF)-like protein/PAS domain S-box-containing protein
MKQAGGVVRLRVAGIIFVGVIAIMMVLQALTLEWRLTTAAGQGAVVKNSGLRRALVMAVLYRASQAAVQPQKGGVIAQPLNALTNLQRSLHDLDPAANRIFTAFVQTARALERNPRNARAQNQLQASRFPLYSAFDRATARYSANIDRSRGAFVKIGFIETLVTLIVAGFLYFAVLRPGERAIVASMNESEARRERFAAMFDHSSEMMAVYDLRGQIVRANKTALDRLGFGAEIVGKRFDVHVAPAAREQADAEFRRAMSGEAVEFTSTFLDVKGREVPVTSNLSPIIVSGEVVGIAGAARDETAERLVEQEIQRSHERYRSLFAGNPCAVLSIDADGRITDANAALEHLTGYAIEGLVGKDFFATLVPPGERASALARFTELMHGPPRSYLASMYTKDKKEFLLEVDAAPIRVGSHVEGVFYVARDAARETALRSQLNQSEERIRTLLHIAGASWRGGGRIGEALLLGSRMLETTYGFVISFERGSFTVRHRYGPDDFLPAGQTVSMPHPIASALAQASRTIAAGEQTAEAACFIGCPILVDQETYGALLFMNRIGPREFAQADLDFVDLMASLVASAVGQDAFSAEMTGKAMHDKLTGLANRAMLEDQFRRMSARAKRKREKVAAYYIDLDGFKPVNDAHGHGCGDEVLCGVARRFGAAIRAEDTLARVGGDEFVVLQNTDDPEHAVQRLSARLLDSLLDPIQLSTGALVQIGASIGVAIHPEDGAELEQLLQFADRGMYADKRIKAQGKQSNTS